MLQRVAMNSRFLTTKKTFVDVRRISTGPPKLSDILTASAGAGEHHTKGASDWRKKFLPADVFPIVGIVSVACAFGVYAMFFTSYKPEVMFDKQTRSELNFESERKKPFNAHLPLASIGDSDKVRQIKN